MWGICGDNSIEKDVSLLRLLQNAVQLSDVLYLLRRELGDACDEIKRHFLLQESENRFPAPLCKSLLKPLFKSLFKPLFEAIGNTILVDSLA